MITVIGCGNPARSDDGVGVWVAQQLMIEYREDAQVRVLDAGTSGIEVMFKARGSDALIIIDAVASGAEPGQLFEVPGAELANPAPQRAGAHGFRWDHALHAGRALFGPAFPTRVAVFLIEAANLSLGLELTDTVAAAAQRVLARIHERIDSYRPVQIRVASGDLCFDHALYQRHLQGILCVALVRSAQQLMIFPLHAVEHGGLLLKQRNACGDRIVHAQAFLRDNALSESAAQPLEAIWDAQVGPGRQPRTPRNMTASLAMQHVEAALAAADWESAALSERVEMLVEIATQLQTRPRNPEDLLGALRLYDRALELCPPGSALLAARVAARRGTALQGLPGATLEQIEQALHAFEHALQLLAAEASAEELAELEMNLGLAKHTLAAHGRSRLNESVAHYQRALRTFTRERFPAECAMLHNNLATAYLALPASDHSGRLREALAVQSFEAALQIITLEEFPNEYAMLQNNLGNALQSSTSGHPLANRLRAVQAYEAALAVRTATSQPGAYANTIANLALCLSNLPDDIEQPELGNSRNLARAHQLYGQAIEIFQQQAEPDKAAAIAASRRELGLEQAR